MASHQLIEGYLADLHGKLPPSTVEELADGLHETWEHHLRLGMNPDHAAQQAIAEFGTPQQVNDAFVAHAGGRRTARLLLATGPAVGICWGASLITSRAWTWHIPAAAAIGYAILLLGTVACLALAATSRHHFHRTRLGNLGAINLLALDLAMLAAVLLSAPNLVWPMAFAIPASLIRIGLTIQKLPMPHTTRRS